MSSPTIQQSDMSPPSVQGVSIIPIARERHVHSPNAAESKEASQSPPEQVSPHKSSSPDEGSGYVPLRRLLPFVESESESEGSPVKAPRGRLAAQLQDPQRDISDKGPNETANSETAYERIRRQLMKSNSNEVQTRRDTTFGSGHESSTDSEREYSPIKRQKLKRKRLLGKLPSLDHLESSKSDTKRGESPGLFVSPLPSPRRPSSIVDDFADDSESESSIMPSHNPKLQALIAKRRQERLEKELSVKKHLYEVGSPEGELHKPLKRAVVRAEAEDDDEQEAGLKLTQQARPTRKASRKAIEEMHRETQRISRSMQLTHQAKTKIKFSQDGFFSKFNFKRTRPKSLDPVPEEAVSSSSPAATSDTEAPAVVDTPPSSPLSLQDYSNTNGSLKTLVQDSLSGPSLKSDRSGSNAGANEAPATTCKISSDNNQEVERPTRSIERASVRKLEKSKCSRLQSDSDDDLEILDAKLPNRLPIFDHLPKQKAQEPHSLLKLRALAYLNDKTAKGPRYKHAMTRTELNAKLHQNSRKQALLEREEKIQRARGKGIDIQTTEEKEKQQLEIETLIEKARTEADMLAKREKEAAKKTGKEGEDESGLPDSEDEEWEESEDENEQKGSEDDIELSGSEEEQDTSDDEADEDIQENETIEIDEPAQNLLFDDEAGEEDDVSDDRRGSDGEAEEDNEIFTHERGFPLKSKPRARKVVTSDDEDEDAENTKTPVGAQIAAPQFSQNDSKVDPFSFVNSKPANLGLSQIFAGTMAETQTQGGTPQQDSMEFLRNLPVEDGIVVSTPPMHLSQELLVQDSQTQENETRENAGAIFFETYSQAGFPQTQVSELPDATQDIGFQDVIDSQLASHSASYSTVDTVPLDEVESTEPETLKKRARLRRRGEVQNLRDEADETVVEGNRNAFLIMHEAPKRLAAVDQFDKKKSGAKEMVEEQAEESEDEYAGLGGASDDESTGELDEDTKGMIDDESNEKLNERDIAAFYANKARAEDEKDIENLYKDIVNGGLRRKRGAEMDLWDPDDEDEMAARRRENKQREFAKMRKALLADEKLGKIAENPKRAAFLQAIEDRREDDYFDVLEMREESISQITDSQNAVSTQSVQVLTTISGNKNKRSWSQFAEEDQKVANQEGSHQPNTRRKTTFTKPTSLADIRNTLSELIGEPESIAETQELLSSEESGIDEDNEDEEMDEDDLAFIDDSQDPVSTETSAAARRVPASAARSAVIDRMALRRAASSSVNASSDETNDRLAFHAPSRGSSFTFKVPSLLRRATNSSITSSTSESEGAASRGVTSNLGMNGEKQGVKMGGSKKSSVNYYVREQERKSRLELVEKERIEGRERVGRMRRLGMSSALGVLVGGKFS